MVLLRQVFGMAVVVVLVGTETAAAQGSADTLPSGRVVRLKTASEVIEGRLAHPLPTSGGVAQLCAWDPGPCSGKSTIRSISLQDVQHIDVRHTYSGRTALAFGIIGALGGYATGRKYDGECAGGCGTGIRFALTGGLVLAGLGAILGTGIGEWVPLR